MTDKIKYFYDIVQGTDEWLRIKHGVLSASTLKNVITAKKLELSTSAKTKVFYDQILSQRIDPTIEHGYMSDDMQRGHDDEPYMVKQYEEEYGREVRHCGFVINSELGFRLGWSPDGLVGDEGSIEGKSRVPKHQIATILNHVCGRTDDLIPSEYMMQIQTGLFVSQRKWCDFISFCNGHQMVKIRVEPITAFQEAIEHAAISFEGILRASMKMYMEAVKIDPRLTLTPRRKIEVDMT